MLSLERSFLQELPRTMIMWVLLITSPNNSEHLFQCIPTLGLSQTIDMALDPNTVLETRTDPPPPEEVLLKNDLKQNSEDFNPATTPFASRPRFPSP